MTNEAVRDSGNGENGESGGGKVADSFLILHRQIRDTNAALRYPSSDEQPATVNMLHIADTDEYTFVKIFDDESIQPKYYHVKIDGEQVGLNAKTMMTRQEIEGRGSKGAEDAANWMKAQDILELSRPSEEDEIEFANCFADFLHATRDGTLQTLDLRGMSPEST
jgi:hypothetical protein